MISKNRNEKNIINPQINLYDAFKSIYKQRKIWDYYCTASQGILTEDLWLHDPKKFIEINLKEGSKEYSGLLKENFTEILNDERALHTVSIFFLGLHIYENSAIIKEKIDTKLSELRKKVGCCISIKFNYYWFLICFYHDIAYQYEEPVFDVKNPNTNITIKQKNELPKDLILNVPPYNNAVPELYKTVLYNYYRYRASHGKNDHGIFGGLLFFNDMKKKYEAYREELNNPTEPFEKNSVRWSKNILEEVHGYVAWVIMAHNIWFLFPDDPDYERIKIEYRKYELHELMLDQRNPVVTLENPFLYLLCIVDTVDPVKNLYDQKNMIGALSNIHIKVDHSELTLTINKGIIRDCDKYKKGVNDLKKWVDLKQFKVSLG